MHTEKVVYTRFIGNRDLFYVSRTGALNLPFFAGDQLGRRVVERLSSRKFDLTVVLNRGVTRNSDKTEKTGFESKPRSY